VARAILEEMFRIGPLVVLAACAATPPAAGPVVTPTAAVEEVPVPGVVRAPADPLGIDWRTVSWDTEDEARAIWRRLALTGDDFVLRMSYLPTELPALREALARALLREGNFACPASAVPLDCERVLLEHQAIAPDDHLGSPCLRRELAWWALDQLDTETLVIDLADELVALAGLPPPEDQLNRAALHRAESDEGLLLRMLDAAERAGNEQVADEALGSLSEAGLATAALHLHIDGAVEALDVDGALDVYLQAIHAAGLRRATRLRALGDLARYGTRLDPGEPARPRVIAALERAAAADDCGLAGAAAAGLAAIRGRPFPASLPRRARPEAASRTVCKILVGVEEPGPLLASLVGPHGVIVEEQVADPDRVASLWAEPADDAAPDQTATGPDGAPSTWSLVRRVPRAELASLPFLDELARALPGCDLAGECKLPGEQVWLRLHWRKGPGGRLVLDRLVRREPSSGC
jgi:hypothetical protein